jgi:SAM-dependent methyltransferase
LLRKATFNLDVLLPRFVPGGSLLEVGCGAGMYLDLMRALGWERVVGVDTSPAATEMARSVLGIEAHCGSLESIGFPSDSFDVLSASHTLEHLHDPGAFLVDVHRILKRGGTLALALPNLGSLGFRVFGPAWYHLDAPRHLIHFTCSSLRFAIERAGLQVSTLATSARAAAWTALFSRSLACGETGGFWHPDHRASRHRRLRAACFSMIEHTLVAGGVAAGEEIHLTARKRT